MSEDFTYQGDEDDDEDELRMLLGGAPPPPQAKKPEKPKYICAGSRRVDEDTGKKRCDYKAVKKWYSYCPKCEMPYACLPIKKGKNETSRVTLGSATMDAAKPLVYFPTGIKELDSVLGGGVVYEKTILLGSPRGSGKPLACDTPVPTPTGWSTQERLRAGDWVIGADGLPAKVLGNTGPMYGKKCYRLHFSDGSSIVADGEHPWATKTVEEREGYQWNIKDIRPESLSRHRWGTIRTTEDIASTLTINGGTNHSIEPMWFFRGPSGHFPPFVAYLRRYIVKVEPIDSVPVCCISTDRPDGLYVVGKQWIVTHNTTMLLQACNGFAQDGRKAYFASGEMTSNAVIDYAKRLGIVNDNLALFGDPEGVDVEELFDDVLGFGAKFLAIDSIQVCTVSDVKGDIGQVTMMDAVANMVTSFAQKKRRAIMMISQLQKAGDYAGSEKVQHLVDGLLRLDIKFVEEDGKMKDIGVREISMDGKSRQGRADITSLVELTDKGIMPPSAKALKALSNLHFG